MELVPSLNEILRGQTGITLIDVGLGGRKTINILGMESQHSLILIDGKRITASDDVVGHSVLSGSGRVCRGDRSAGYRRHS